jgi:hypothetical protein
MIRLTPVEGPDLSQVYKHYTLGQQIGTQERQQKSLADIGLAYKEGGLSAAQGKAFETGNPEMGLRFAQEGRAAGADQRQQVEFELNQLGRVVDAVEKEPARWPAIRQSLIQRGAKGLADPAFNDPGHAVAMGKNMLADIERRLKNAQIGMTEAHTDLFRAQAGKAAVEAAGGGVKPPAGFRWADPQRSQLEAIPGGPGEHQSSEVAGRLAMLKTAEPGLVEARKVFLRDWGVGDFVRSQFNDRDPAAITGEIGRARRSVRLAIEGALRAMTGAAAPETEVARYEQLFLPSSVDDKTSAKQKLDALESFMRNAEEIVTRGRRTATPTATAAPGAQQAKRLKYNPETGEIE